MSLGRSSIISIVFLASVLYSYPHAWAGEHDQVTRAGASSECTGDAAPEGWTRKSLDSGIDFDYQGRAGKRRLRIPAKVCLREGDLEHLLTQTGTKEHESVFATDIQGKYIHAALLLARARPGKHAVEGSTSQAPTGTRIRIMVEYEAADGRKYCAAAQRFIKSKTGGTMKDHWVFTGSRVVKGSGNDQHYAADFEGDLITVSNFSTSLIDIDTMSSESKDAHSFAANTDQIPAKGSKVTLVLIPE